MDVEKLCKVGKEMGLLGEPLRVWVEKQLADDAEKKQKEREDKEKEREERDKEWARMETKERVIEKELELLRLRNESPNASSGTSDRGTPGVGKSPKLPYFEDGKDQIDSYLIRFERYAQINKWSRNDWATHLSALLKGKALEAYCRLTVDESCDYDKVKETLLKRYNLTEEGFNVKFRNSRPEPGERMSNFRARIFTYLDKWLELAGKSKSSLDELRDLMVKEQLINACGPELATFLKERKPPTSEAVATLVEQYTDAHGMKGAFSRPMAATTKAIDSRSQVSKSGQPTSANSAPQNTSSNQSILCRNCGKRGHVAKDCRSNKTQASAVEGPPVCKHCKRKGHTVETCWEKKRKEPSQGVKHQVAAVETENPAVHQRCTEHSGLTLDCGCDIPVLSAACTPLHEVEVNVPVAEGEINGKAVKVMRDTGCTDLIVSKCLVNEDMIGKQLVPVRLADSRIVHAPRIKAYLDCPYFVGETSAIVMDAPLHDVILGNIRGAKCPCLKTDDVLVQVAETRAASKKKIKDLLTPGVVDTGVSVSELIEKQKNDETLKPIRELATKGQVRKTGKANEAWFTYTKGVLFRHFRSPKVEYGDVIKQVVVPLDLRNKVMTLGHENLLAGHLATKKTAERILTNFYWPNLWEDVTRFCQSCDQCQRSTPKGKTPKVPLTKMPLIDEPFSRVAVDIIGPIVPASERGHRYVLTLVDYSTRYPEAIPLKSIETERVAEALVDIFSRVGIPQEILSDRGIQFTSDLMTEVCRLLSMSQLVTTPYHPQCNGLVERFNATLKSMLKKLAAERPRDWDRYINAALFAYREAPSESLGFSPFELLFGRTVRGPMTVLRELWTGDINNQEVKTSYQYVLDLKEKLEETVKVAKENLKLSSGRYKKHFDQKAKQRKFQPGDKVLLLRPTKENKLELKWQGPFELMEEKGHNNYSVSIGGKNKTYHANILKRYHERPEALCTGVLTCAVATVIEEEEEADESGEAKIGNKGTMKIDTPICVQTEDIDDVKCGEGLTPKEREQLRDVFSKFEDVLTDVPGRTTMIEHSIRLTSTDPIRKKPYPVPQALREVLRDELDMMIKADIIEPSTSPYCSPSVVVKKKDGSNRYCIDFRALNNVTVFDAEPIPRPDELFQEIGVKSRYFTKIDLSKGYWQIPMAEESKPLTAFATEKGLFQFKMMPFGLQGAPATFSRLMRQVIHGVPHVQNFIDDILLHTETWDEHLTGLETLFSRLRAAGLTARPSKCLVAFQELEFLGHNIGNGQMAPVTNKVEAIKEAIPPSTKKEMRSFLGLASFYRRYVPNFAAISSPLSDTTRKGKPNQIVWEEPQKRAFETLKEALSSQPVLHLPDFQKSFILRTDASDRGLGAILLQQHGEETFPVVYLSRKLLPREQKYSVIEKECLALVWAMKSLQTYLLGREFVVETDRAPLLYLNKAKMENGRLMRWALLLHQYRFTIKSVKGSLNHGPDFLSRAH